MTLKNHFDKHIRHDKEFAWLFLLPNAHWLKLDKMLLGSIIVETIITINLNFV